MKQYYKLVKYFRAGNSEAWPTEVSVNTPQHINDAIDRAISIVDRERGNGLTKVCVFRVSLTKNTTKLSASVSPSFQLGNLYNIRDAKGKLTNGGAK